MSDNMFHMTEEKYIDLLTLQTVIKEQVDGIEAWVKVEVDSCNQSGGHHYLGLIQKSEKGAELAKARGIIWRSHADLLAYFKEETGKDLAAGMEILAYVSVSYDARFGLSLVIKDIDPEYTIGRREQEKKETMRRLAEEGLVEAQKELALPFLPGRIAVISSSTAAGYGDFMKQLSENPYGFVFNTTLFDSLMQGDSSPKSVAESLKRVCESPDPYDLVVVMRGGGAESDMFCFDDYQMCRAIASCHIPVLTAIGHERDFHIADMVANEYFKTPTALAAFLVQWVADVEMKWTSVVDEIRLGLDRRINALANETSRCVSNIAFALGATLSRMDHSVSLLEQSIRQADPREILRQGYVMATDRSGRLLRSASSAGKGDEFVLRFADGCWDCEVKDIKRN